MRRALILAAGAVLLGLAVAGAVIAVPLVPAFAAMQWGVQPMTPTRQQSLLRAQTALARKVYDVVPIQSPWTPLQIKGALAAGGSPSAARSAAAASLARVSPWLRRLMR